MASEAVEKLVAGLKSLSELEITTVVGDVTFEISQNELGRPTVALRPTGATPVALNGCYTNIDLAGGDIQNLIDATFLQDDKAAVLTFHREQVTTGREIVRTNVDMLIKLSKAAGAKLAPLLGMEAEPKPTA